MAPDPMAQRFQTRAPARAHRSGYACRQKRELFALPVLTTAKDAPHLPSPTRAAHGQSCSKLVTGST